MRITISHSKTQLEVIQMVDKSTDDLFKGATGPVQLADSQKSWQESTMTFSTVAKAGFINAPIRGTVLVTEVTVVIDADIGMFEKFITQQQAQSMVEGRVKGLLS